MMSSNILLFPGRVLTWYDATKFQGHWRSSGEVTQGGGGGIRLPPVLPDSERPGLFRVKGMLLIRMRS